MNDVTSIAPPTALTPILANIPHELKLKRNWIVWRYEQPKPGKTKPPKVPYTSGHYVPARNGNGKAAAQADTTDPTTWGSYDEAVQALEQSKKWKRPFNGIGFVFDGVVREDELVYLGVDFDDIVKLPQKAR